MFQRRIVCAANRHKDSGFLLLGVRHYDMIMHSTIEELKFEHKSQDFVQGFVDNKGEFLTREEAFQVAKEANQIINKTGNVDQPVLYSEDLY